LVISVVLCSAHLSAGMVARLVLFFPSPRTSPPPPIRPNSFFAYRLSKCKIFRATPRLQLNSAALCHLANPPLPCKADFFRRSTFMKFFSDANLSSLYPCPHCPQGESVRNPPPSRASRWLFTCFFAIVKNISLPPSYTGLKSAVLFVFF